ncbi:MAG: BMP family ABC transporter substrate-binding protein [Treponema sp.]|jgi:simple sugar transport system substrate-binding protein|nr:BMP family ABC transporter substrate-binding protein [Treponema sp.]
MKNSTNPVHAAARQAALLAAALVFLGTPAFAGGAAQGAAQGGGPQDGASLSVLVYIAGMLAGSPPYEMLAAGAERFAAAHPGVRVKVYEAGFNQAEWEEQLASLVASGEYDIVLGSNPSLPEICASVGKKFPRQKFIITDAWYEGNPQISTCLYNQYEQSLYLGYLAGLITVSDMAHANPAKRLGFIAAQEYPLLNNHIVPGFLAGAKLADPGITVDFRVIGNWYDANKAAELAGSMIDSGVDVFAVIAGGAAQGLIKTAVERGAYIVFHNTNEYRAAPGFILGCGLMEQQKLVEEILSDVLAGTIQYGTSRIVGAADGYLDFIADDPGYSGYVPPEIRAKFDAFLSGIKAGRVDYTLPPL